MREPSPTLLGEGEDDGEGTGPMHLSFPPAYRHWHAEKGEWLKVGTVSMAAQTKSSGKDPRYNQGSPGKSGGVVEIRTSGHCSEDGKDSITFPERRTRGPGWSLLSEPEAGRVPERAGGVRRRDIGDEGHVKPRTSRGDADLALKLGGSVGRAWLMATHLGLKPDWRKVNVRNFRGGTGTVGYGGTRNPLHNRKSGCRSLSA
jgi:hypothetical protein